MVPDLSSTRKFGTNSAFYFRNSVLHLLKSIQNTEWNQNIRRFSKLNDYVASNPKPYKSICVFKPKGQKDVHRERTQSFTMSLKKDPRLRSLREDTDYSRLYRFRYSIGSGNLWLSQEPNTQIRYWSLYQGFTHQGCMNLWFLKGFFNVSQRIHFLVQKIELLIHINRNYYEYW